MKVARVDDNKVVIDDIPEPIIDDDSIVVRMRACGICGSDLEKVYGRYGVVSNRLGHEPAGEVIRVGKNIEYIEVGDRVFVHHHVPCYECHYCKHGDYTMCREYQRSNIEPCGLAEAFLVPAWNIKRGGVIRLPDDMGFEEAAMIEPLACCIRAIDKVNLMHRDNIAVIGTGPTGLMQIMLAKFYGADKIFAIDINEFRLGFAKRYGAIPINANDKDLKERVMNVTTIGVDAAIISTSNPSAFNIALDIVRSGGKIVIFGVPSRGSMIDLDLNKVFTNEIKILPSLAAAEMDTNKAFRLISEGSIDIASIITHRFGLEESDKAFRVAHEGRDVMKVLITN